MMSPYIAPLVAYVRSELDVSDDAIALALRKPLLSPCHLPVALWQLGLVSLEDVNKIFEWLENSAGQTAIAA